MSNLGDYTPGGKMLAQLELYRRFAECAYGVSPPMTVLVSNPAQVDEFRQAFARAGVSVNVVLMTTIAGTGPRPNIVSWDELAKLTAPTPWALPPKLTAAKPRKDYWNVNNRKKWSR